MSDHDLSDRQDLGAVPPIVDQAAWDVALAELRTREKAATRELDAIAAVRRRLPMVELPEYTLEGADGAVRLADMFEGKRTAHRVQPHVVSGRDLAMPGLHRAHEPIHPAGVPGPLRRPVRHRHPGPYR